MHPARHRIRRLLVANRSEIAIRIMRAAAELRITTVAIYSEEDRFALHRHKADESYLVGKGKGPINAYLDIADIVRIAREHQIDAIHPGYGFLSENPAFAESCEGAGIRFIGPPAEVMRRLGNKVEARRLAEAAGLTVMPATQALPREPSAILDLARRIGFPVMIKASWGGGGRGMRVVLEEARLIEEVEAARRETLSAFGNDEIYLEKLVRNARHVEVQILGDMHGNVVHLFERDCSLQRRHQKIIERAPAPYLDGEARAALTAAALQLARAVDYAGAGTVEFLQDADSNAVFFIEVNPRIQVEHTVTECVTGIDLVKAQIRIAEGARIGDEESGLPRQEAIRLSGHAVQCRVTSEDPTNNFIPDYGRITAYRSAAGFGVRLDGGTAFTGAVISRYYDSLLVKITTWGQTAEEAIARMDRSLREFRVRGVATNLRFLQQLVRHPRFQSAAYNTRFVDETPDLLRFPAARDRATRLLRFLGEVIVNGNAEIAGRPRPPAELRQPEVPPHPSGEPPPGARQLLQSLGPDGFARWMREEQRVLVTDTTMRDAHQSLLATRMRSIDLLRIAPAYAQLLPELLSLECWGGATFDVALRYLKECPWDRLAALRERVPNLLLQMLLRSANGVGYTNYPDNVVRYFVERAAAQGIDLFRVFDSLNWVENMRVAIDAVGETGQLCEAAICYTGDIENPQRSKYSLQYYVSLAKELARAGAHIIGIKDMAGVCRPGAARMLVRALKDEIELPIHFHTHDTSGIAAASVLAAVEAGVDAIDAAIDSMSGLTSQPNLGAIVEALRHDRKSTELDPERVRQISNYWAQARELYAAFESGIRAGASEVYVHEMPGGQYTNLREQARSLGIGSARWHEVARAYAEVNEMFGDIIKVTPTSKVVGDLALMMVAQRLSPADILDPGKEIAFPDSVVSLFRGDIGQPPGGFPPALQRKVLKGTQPFTGRPGERLAPVELEATRASLQKELEHRVGDEDLASALMYPRVFADFAAHRRAYGDVSVLPTAAFFYGMEPGEEITVELERGKVLIIRFMALGDADDAGHRNLFFEVNGQPRSIKVVDRERAATRPAKRRAEAGNPLQLGAPMPGRISSIPVKPGQKVTRGEIVLTLEGMKMETSVCAEADATVLEVAVAIGDEVEARELLLRFAS